jgi:hypothetical protein
MRWRRDEIVTTFCESVTPRCEAMLSRAPSLDTKVMGEAMAPASGFQPSGGRSSGAGAAPVFLLALLIACGDDPQTTAPPPPAPTQSRPAADPAEGVTTDLDGVAPEFSVALVAELEGDDAAARAGFERVLAAPDAPPLLAARAALHLAQYETRAGKSRHALDLVARATTLAPGDAAIAEGVAQVEADVVAASGAGDIRGPKLGTPLPGVDPKVADAFAAADRALVQVHAIRPRQRLDVWAKEDATEDVAARYRKVAEAGGLAKIAADYRIGSLYHDLALGLLFELPSGLAPSVAGELRRTLRTRALAYLKRAVASYQECLAAPKSPDAELWQLAAETDLRNARDVLGEASQ